jgi:hypothetical protein
MEISQIINVLEDSPRSEVILTSWDIKRAFDSVSKPFAVAAWMRLGVPEFVAEYFVQMDVDGVTVIKGDHGRHVIDTFGISGATVGIESTIYTVKSHTARDGFGQGDAIAAPGWKAVYDIQLVALDYVDIISDQREADTLAADLGPKEALNEQSLDIDAKTIAMPDILRTTVASSLSMTGDINSI